MNTRNLREQRAALITQANALLTENVALNEEQRSKFDALYAEADGLKQTIDRAERAAAAEAELRELQPVVKPVVEGDAKAAEVRAAKYTSAFNKYLREGKEGLNAEERSLLSENRAQSVTTGSGGAYTVPQGFMNELAVALKHYGGIRDVARSLVTSTGNPLPWPTNNDTSNMGSRLGATSVPGTAQEVDLTFGQVNLNAWTYTSQAITVPNELLQDSAFDLEAFIKEQFVTRIGRIQNNEFTVYSGGNGPQGVVPFATGSATGVTAATGGTTAITYDNLVDLIHSVDLAYRKNGTLMFNDLTFSVIRKIKDNYGRPLLAPGIDGSDPDKILGYKYVVNNDMAVPGANAYSMLFGDFSKYIVRDIANSTAIMRLDQLNALNNQTTFVAFTRSDARGVDAGTHPISFFKQSAT
jgi:HK97 family phage major capsid protein